MVAAAALRVPVRVHTLHGLRYESATGSLRRILWTAQRASCLAATRVVCVSPSLRERAVETGLLREGEGIVIGDGSANGVDAVRFSRTVEAARAGAALREQLGIAPDVPVVGYLGRLARDKGIGDLAAAWERCAGRGWQLLVAGEIDPTDPPPREALELFDRSPDVRRLGQLTDPRGFLAAIDVLSLPTWREGFPTVALEAAAMERPVVATRATGCVDAVVDGETGTLVPVSDPVELAAALERALLDPASRSRQGAAARKRVLDHYTTERMHRLTVELYQSLLGRSA
jgi:glycosyltransferase involved in cell wall biosynthesis